MGEDALESGKTVLNWCSNCVWLPNTKYPALALKSCYLNHHFDFDDPSCPPVNHPSRTLPSITMNRSIRFLTTRTSLTPSLLTVLHSPSSLPINPIANSTAHHPKNICSSPSKRRQTTHRNPHSRRHLCISSLLCLSIQQQHPKRHWKITQYDPHSHRQRRKTAIARCQSHPLSHRETGNRRYIGENGRRKCWC